MDINDLCDNPEENGFSIKVTCDKCGSDNYFQSNEDAMNIGCLSCAPDNLPEKEPDNDK